MVSKTIKSSAVVAQIALTSSVALLTHGTKQEGRYAYNTMTVQMFSELIKLCLSSFLLSLEYAFSKDLPHVTLDPWRLAKASIPALLYFISNNVNFWIIAELTPAAFQILNNMKILTTAVMFKFMMKADITPLQWRMLVLLMAGSIMSQLGGCSETGLRGTMKGYSLKLMNSVLTATATVYNEKFMKGNDDSIHFQNCQLYSFGLVFGVVAVSNKFGWETLNLEVVTSGYDLSVVVLVLNYAFVGMATSAVVKYLDNMTKTFAANAAMFIVAIISIIFYNEPVTLHLFVGMVVAALSVEVYNRHQHFTTPVAAVAAAAPEGAGAPQPLSDPKASGDDQPLLKVDIEAHSKDTVTSPTSQRSSAVSSASARHRGNAGA